jgi:hypothetical protein
MTSGSFRYHDGRPGFANPPTNFSNVRKQTFTLSHLRTWKSWLWKKIKPEDSLLQKQKESTLEKQQRERLERRAAIANKLKDLDKEVK